MTKGFKPAALSPPEGTSSSGLLRKWVVGAVLLVGTGYGALKTFQAPPPRSPAANPVAQAPTETVFSQVPSTSGTSQVQAPAASKPPAARKTDTASFPTQKDEGFRDYSKEFDSFKRPGYPAGTTRASLSKRLQANPRMRDLQASLRERNRKPPVAGANRARFKRAASGVASFGGMGAQGFGGLAPSGGAKTAGKSSIDLVVNLISLVAAREMGYLTTEYFDWVSNQLPPTGDPNGGITSCQVQAMKFVMGQGKPDGSDKTQFEEQCPSSIDDTFESIAASLAASVAASVAVSVQAPGEEDACKESGCLSLEELTELLQAAKSLQ